VIQLLRINDRLTDQEIYDRVDSLAKLKGYSIPDDVVEILDQELGKRKQKFIVDEIDDLSSFKDLSGKVMDINRQVSFKSRLKIDITNPISKGLAGDLLKYDFTELIVRENPDKFNHSKQYRIFVKSSIFRTKPINIGQTLLAAIVPINNRLMHFWEAIDYKPY